MTSASSHGLADRNGRSTQQAHVRGSCQLFNSATPLMSGSKSINCLYLLGGRGSGVLAFRAGGVTVGA
jgi:hypothetical protein